ncbi:hypothetical protein BEP19_08710 [Ammoniphilus oxalaticus]|uniref:Uncharacterized protein n=1 Tax=Ammoniphilus oxalaticus TaxID=66863 RepID=A0A419SKL7_9BACL|nr:hypothetical protein [Ammoniphilus oxalaticus]RKD24458.1 hypothetical protein BEP19_08710 [Ammoniphilus oxalaticus]
MNHNLDYDRDGDREDALGEQDLRELLSNSMEIETELMRRYIITAERIHQNPVLKDRLENFAQGNAKRTRQLQDEISSLTTFE